MPFETIITEDGSLSCLDPETKQLCHNRAGAFTEAMTNYVLPSGLLETLQQNREINVLDACYGLGYNTWALVQTLGQYLESQTEVKENGGSTTKKPYIIRIEAVEISPEIIRFLPEVLNHPNLNDLKNKIATLEHNIYYRTLIGLESFDVRSSMNPIQLEFQYGSQVQVVFRLWLKDLRQHVLALASAQQDFDVIFHDPFSPQKMPELWTVDLFQRYHLLLRAKQGRVLTYSTAAAVRGGLIEAGFQVGKLRGLGKKAGASIAFANSDPLKSLLQESSICDLEAWEKAYLSTKAGIPYRDPGLCSARELILQQREQEQASSNRPSGSTVLKQKRGFSQ